MVLGEYLIELLEAQNVKHVFGIPGVHTVELYRGLAKSQITHILPRHEQGAGFMADGYARVTGKPGVCFVITGPGLTNILTPVGQAYADSIPMLIISGVNKRKDLGHGHGLLHEMPDQQGLLKELTAFSHTVQSAEELPGVLARAFAVFSSGRPRPVHIEVPIDMMVAPASTLPAPSLYPRILAPGMNDTVLDDVVARIRAAKAPLVILGGGCSSTDQSQIDACVTQIGAPAIQTVNGRNCLAFDNPYAVPASPSLNAVRDAMASSDLIVAFGTEFGRTDYDMFGVGMPQIECPIIRFDIDPKQLAGSQFSGRFNSRDLLITCDVSMAFSALNGKLLAPVSSQGAAWANRIRESARREITPDMQEGVGFLESLRAQFPNAIVVGDSTQPIYAGNLFYAPSQSGMWFNSSVGYGTLGYALPAAIGAKLGRPGQPVISLIGDGGLQFTLNEFGSIPADFPVITIIWNNNGYEEIKTSMISAGVEPVGVSIDAPNFEYIAKAYGLDFVLVTTMTQLLTSIGESITKNMSVVLELDVDTGFDVLV